MGHFANFSDFLAMGGYAAYVWSGVGLCIGLLIALTTWSIKQRAAAFKEIAQQNKIEKLRHEHQNSEMTL